MFNFKKKLLIFCTMLCMIFGYSLNIRAEGSNINEKKVSNNKNSVAIATATALSITQETSTIIPSLVFDKTSYTPGSSVNMYLKLTGTHTGDKTNSVTFTIDFDGNTFDLATGNPSNDIKAGYLPITTKSVTGTGASRKIVVMYTDMSNNINLQEGAVVFSVNLKVKGTVAAGSKKFTLEPVNMLDSSFKVYNINNGQPVNAYVQVNSADTTAPVVISTTPANNATGVAVGSNIAVKFSEYVVAGTNFGAITIKNPSGVVITTAKTISGDTLVLDPSVNLSSNTKYTVTIPTAAVKDVTGNVLPVQYVFSFTTTASNAITPNLIFDKTSYTPGSSVNMYLKLTGTHTGDKTNSVTFTIDFDGNTFDLATGNPSNDIKAGYLPITTKSVTGTGASRKIVVMYTDMSNNINLQEGAVVFSVNLKVKGTVAAGSKKFTLEPVNMLDSSFKVYNINNGQPVNAYVQVNSADTTAPVVISTTPANNATGVAVGSNIAVKFSEYVIAGTNFGAITIKNPSGVVITTAKTISGDTLVIDPSVNLSTNTKYTVTIPAAAVKDVAGNVLSVQYVFSFTTTASNVIIPNLVFDKTSYTPGGSVNVSFKLTGTHTGDKTNSVTFTIDFDGNTFDLATGNPSNDIKAGYLPITTKSVTGTGASRKIVVMYTDMSNNINLQEGAVVFTVNLRVKSTASAGSKTFTLEPVNMLDSSFKVYNINNGQPLSRSVSIVY